MAVRLHEGVELKNVGAGSNLLRDGAPRLSALRRHTPVDGKR
jgi:hypothetical protein